MAATRQVQAPHVLRPMRFDGDRRYALALAKMRIDEDPHQFVTAAQASIGHAMEERAVLAYAFVDARHADAVFEQLELTSLGSVPALVRPLRLSAAAARLTLPEAVRAVLPRTALLLPFGRRRRAGVREITTQDPRFTRLWDRFSIDIGVAVERNAAYVNPRIFDRPLAGYRVFIFEDGDRYVTRALCIFRTSDEDGRVIGQVIELLHDRSVAGMRAASHLLGLALREMSDAGAERAEAWSLPQSGSFPLYARHAFLPAASGPGKLRFGVRALDPDVEHVVTQRHHWYLSGLDFDSI
jgi:hypothetical protein